MFVQEKVLPYNILNQVFNKKEGFEATLYIDFDSPKVYATSFDEFKKQKAEEKEEKKRRRELRKIKREETINQLAETEKKKPGKGIPIKKK